MQPPTPCADIMSCRCTCGWIEGVIVMHEGMQELQTVNGQWQDVGV